MFTPFHKALLALVAIGFFAVGATIWTRGAAGLAAPTAAERAAPVSPAAALSQSAPPPGIVAIGEASVRAVADSAYVAFAVQAGGPLGSDIAKELQTRVDRLLAKVRELGVADADIILGPVQFQPQYQYDPQKGGPKVISFNAYQQIAIECDEISGMPLLMQTLTKDDATSALSVRYAPSEEGPAYLVARQKAIADARAKAEANAKAAGLRLGPAISISDYRPAGPAAPYGVTPGKFPTVGGPGFPPAEIDTVIRVQIQFAIAND